MLIGNNSLCIYTQLKGPRDKRLGSSLFMKEHSKMRLKPNRDVVLLFCLGVLCFSQICCVSLEITRRQERHGEEKNDDVRVGTIMFGRDSSDFGPVKNEDGFNIQADAAELVGGQDVIDDSSSSKAAWASMRPTVLCTKDLMKFSAQGPGSSSLQLDRGKGLILDSFKILGFNRQLVFGAEIYFQQLTRALLLSATH